MNAEFPYRLLADLFDELERAGVAVHPGKYLQVQELLRRLPADTPPERLRTLLAPLFATDPAGQRQFYDIFAKSIAQARQMTADAPAEPGPAAPDAGPQRMARRKERRWRRAVLVFPPLLAALAGFLGDPQLGPWYANPTGWLAAAVLAGSAWAALRLLRRWPARGAYLLAAAALFAAGAWLKTGMAPGSPPVAARSLRFAAAAGDTVRQDLRLPADTARLLYAAPQTAVETRLGGLFRVDSAGVATYGARPDAPAGATDSLSARLTYADRIDTVYCLVDLIEKTAPPPPPDTNLIAEIPLPYPRDIAELQVDAAEAARFAWYRHYEWPLKALLALLLGALAWALARWDRYRRAKAVAEIRRADRAPYVWNPDTGADPAADALAAAAQPLLTRLRGRAPDERLRLDLPATVRATSRRAGRIRFAWRRRTLPPDYLLLIDRLAPNDHRARLFDALYQAFLRAEVPVLRYFYDGDPRRCFNEVHPDGIALAELMHRHAGAQLLLVGEGQGLLSAHSGRPAPWTQLLAAWPRRALLSPRPLQAWGARERQLGQLLPLLPASPGGLSAALDYFAADDPADTRDLLRTIRDALQQPFDFGHDLLDDLQRHFEPAVVDWIAACALWPALHWDLTLHLGRALGERLGEDLLTYGRLRELTRLPWFTEGRLPDGARARLLDHLAARGLETPLREALRALLRQTPAPPADSAAYDDYRMNVVLNELVLRPDPAARRRLEREFERYLAAGKKPDFVALRLLDRPATRLDALVGERLKKYAFREGLPGLGWRAGVKLFGIWAALAGTIAWFQPDLNPCPGQRTPYRGLELCLNSGRDSLLYLEYLAADAIEAQNHPRVVSLRAAADAISPRDTAFYLNTAARYYNRGAGYYNRAEQGGPDSLRGLACDNFRRGGALYADLQGSAGFQYYQAMQRACRIPAGAAAPEPSEFAFNGLILDAASGRPLAGAEVRAANSDRVTDAQLKNLPPGRREQAGIAADTTGADGRYTLLIPARTLGTLLRLRAAAPRYAPAALRLAAQDPLPTVRLTPLDTAAETPPDGARLLYSGISLADENGDGRLGAGERAALRFTLKNAGNAPVQGVISAKAVAAPAGLTVKDPSTLFYLPAQKEAQQSIGIALAADKDPSNFRLDIQVAVDNKVALDFSAQIETASDPDDAAWQRAKAAGTPEACRQYLAAYPQGRHAVEAKGCIVLKTSVQISSLPSFPWPPPACAKTQALNSAQIFFTLSDIDKWLNRALDGCQYFNRGYYSVPNGFALVTRLEQFNLDGSNLPQNQRWLNSVRSDTSGSFVDYITSLFVGRKGYFRLFVFVVTDQPVASTPGTGTEIQTNRQIPASSDMRSWDVNGTNLLPFSVSNIAVTTKYRVEVLIYELQSEGSNTKLLLRCPGLLSAKQHLEKSGLLKLLK